MIDIPYKTHPKHGGLRAACQVAVRSRDAGVPSRTVRPADSRSWLGTGATVTTGSSGYGRPTCGFGSWGTRRADMAPRSWRSGDRQSTDVAAPDGDRDFDPISK